MLPRKWMTHVSSNANLRTQVMSACGKRATHWALIGNSNNKKHDHWHEYTYMQFIQFVHQLLKNNTNDTHTMLHVSESHMCNVYMCLQYKWLYSINDTTGKIWKQCYTGNALLAFLWQVLPERWKGHAESNRWRRGHDDCMCVNRWGHEVWHTCNKVSQCIPAIKFHSAMKFHSAWHVRTYTYHNFSMQTYTCHTTYYDDVICV